MMDSLGWGVILMLLGEEPNEIPAGAFISEHIRIDLIMLAVLLASVIPFCMIPAFGKRLARKKYISAVVDTVMLNIAFPTFILLIVPLFFQIVVDKVLVHKGIVTLNSIGIGIVCAVIFNGFIIIINHFADFIFITMQFFKIIFIRISIYDTLRIS